MFNSKFTIDDYLFILNKLPFGISVQDKHRNVLFENDAVIALVGSYFHTHCFHRWKYLGDGKNPCVDCPTHVTFKDLHPHSVYRQTKKNNGQELIIHIQCMPVLDAKGELTSYIEIIQDITTEERSRALIDKSVEEIVNDIQIAMTIFGETGAEILYSLDLAHLNLQSIDETEVFLQQLTVYAFTGIGQGHHLKGMKGLYGPLPVLDSRDHLLLTFIFQIYSEKSTNVRTNKQEACLFMIIIHKDYLPFFADRQTIQAFLETEFRKKQKLEDFTTEYLNDITKKLKELIITLENERAEVKL